MSEPLRVGDVIHGHAGGLAGRDHYDCSRIEAIGSDWVVLRTIRPYSSGIPFAITMRLDQRLSDLKFLCENRDGYKEAHTSGCPNDEE